MGVCVHVHIFGPSWRPMVYVFRRELQLRFSMVVAGEERWGAQCFGMASALRMTELSQHVL